MQATIYNGNAWPDKLNFPYFSLKDRHGNKTNSGVSLEISENDAPSPTR